MLANTLIQTSILALKPSDTIRQALERMAEYGLSQLPVVEGIYLQGMVQEEQLLAAPHPDESVQSFTEYHPEKIAFEQQHTFQIASIFVAQNVQILPLVNAQNEYLGVITAKVLLKAMTSLMALNEPGSLVVLELSSRNYSLQHLAQLVEEEQMAILDASVQSFPNSTRLEVTLKLNSENIDSILASFARHGYGVCGVFNRVSKNENPILERYHHLMNYLNL